MRRIPWPECRPCIRRSYLERQISPGRVSFLDPGVCRMKGFRARSWPRTSYGTVWPIREFRSVAGSAYLAFLLKGAGQCQDPEGTQGRLREESGAAAEPGAERLDQFACINPPCINPPCIHPVLAAVRAVAELLFRVDTESPRSGDAWRPKTRRRPLVPHRPRRRAR